MKELRGKKVLITGAASGIGRAIAGELAHAGAHLWLLDIEEAPLQSLAAELVKDGVEVVTRPCDLRNEEQIRAAFSDVIEAWQGIDVLVNNAGILWYGPTEKMTDQEWGELLAVNLHAPMLLTRLFLPHLLERAEAHILNVCSLYGVVPKRRLAAYQTAKYALVGFSQSLRVEYGRRGIGVTALCPGVVRSDLVSAAKRAGRLQSRLKIPSFWNVTPEKIARRAVRAIQKNHGLVVCPANARGQWLLHRLYPGLVSLVQSFGRRKR